MLKFDEIAPTFRNGRTGLVDQTVKRLPDARDFFVERGSTGDIIGRSVERAELSQDLILNGWADFNVDNDIRCTDEQVLRGGRNDGPAEVRKAEAGCGVSNVKRQPHIDGCGWGDAYQIHKRGGDDLTKRHIAGR